MKMRIKVAISQLLFPYWILMRQTMIKIQPDRSLEKSMIVCAHPDDEALWFSSILCQVNGVVICYQKVASNEVWSSGRKRSLLHYPIKNVSSLEVVESEVFNNDNYREPELTGYGLKIKRDSISADKYKENFITIKSALKEKLFGCQNVYTHNPWGEYGNEEHVQVYKAVKDLQQEFKFNLWFSNYCSEKSIDLLKKTINLCSTQKNTKRTDRITCRYIKHHYRKNRCWTWFNDWTGFREESFIKIHSAHKDNRSSHSLLPLNMVRW